MLGADALVRARPPGRVPDIREDVYIVIGKCVYCFWAEVRRLYGSTRKGTLLESVPPGVVNWILPVVEPAGTVVVISVGETTLKAASVPLKLTLVVPVRSVPRIRMAAPTWPRLRQCFHERNTRPTDRLNKDPIANRPRPRRVVP